jgi:glycosyltransferase involved in cell wall biosynthesis
LGIADSVLFMGSVSKPEALYFAADALVFPSLYEPFGIVVLEAMAAGLPVITSRFCGAVEGMMHEEHGLYLDDPSDINNLCQQMQRLVSDKGLRARLAANGKQEAGKFDWSSIAPQILNIYREVLDDR